MPSSIEHLVSSLFYCPLSNFHKIKIKITQNQKMTSIYLTPAHPLYKLLEENIKAHAEHPDTVEAMNQKKYTRPQPKEFYMRHEQDFLREFGDNWRKRAQNCVSKLYNKYKLPSNKGKGKGGKENMKRLPCWPCSNLSFHLSETIPGWLWRVGRI